MRIKMVLVMFVIQVAGCMAADELFESCGDDVDCSAGKVCDQSSRQCLPLANFSPSMEVWPPSKNKQGLVLQEIIKPARDSSGRLSIRLEAPVSLEGKVVDSVKNTTISASIIAWRTSKLEGRPNVQIETTTTKRQDKESYVMWLGKGRYTFLVRPMPPMDTEYPPLVVSDMAVDGHLKYDFELDGQGKAVEIRGTLLKYDGKALLNSSIRGVNGKLLPSTVRIKAYQPDGHRQSTEGISDGTSGAFSFKVPSGAASYHLKIESLAGSIPVPTTICTNRTLGLASPQQPKTELTQEIGTIRLPSFLLPKLYGVKISDKSGAPIVGATVTFATTLQAVYQNADFDGCTATYRRSKTTDKDGKVNLLLLPGSMTANQVYSVTVESPSTSKFASRWIKSMEVGPNGGQLAPIILDPRYRLRGTVVSKADGSPVAQVLINAYRVQTSTTSQMPKSDASTSTDSLGNFDLYADPGVYNLDLQPPQESGLPSIGLNAKLDGNVDNAKLEIPTPRIVAGKILDPSGKILPFAKVHIYELTPDKTLPVTHKATLRASSVTDSGGEFNLILAEQPNQSSVKK